MATINQKYRLYSQKTKGKEIKHTTTESHQITKGKIERRKKFRETNHLPKTYLLMDLKSEVQALLFYSILFHIRLPLSLSAGNVNHVYTEIHVNLAFRLNLFLLA